jgi:hypothetical protein
MPELSTDKEQYKKLSETMKDGMGIDLKDYEMDFEQWRKFNEMRNEDSTMKAIMKSSRVRVEPKLAVYFMESARNCIIKYDGDEKKVRDCLEGRMVQNET